MDKYLIRISRSRKEDNTAIQNVRSDEKNEPMIYQVYEENDSLERNKRKEVNKTIDENQNINPTTNKCLKLDLSGCDNETTAQKIISDDQMKHDQNANQDIPKAFPRWRNDFSWLGLNTNKRAICTQCTEAVNLNLISSSDCQSSNSKEAFITRGFNSWKNAVFRFKNHEKGSLHRTAIESLLNLKRTTVVQQLSTGKQIEMREARVALKKIFSTINYLARQGLAFRGTTKESSNLLKLLELRAEDVPILQKWLNQKSYKWIHHEIINEILHLMANKVLKQHLTKIKNAIYFSIILDETSDISRLEQVSFSTRIVLDDLTIQEDFLGFYETSSTKSETLFNIVNDIFIRFELSICNIRGQCYDGARNVSGRITGLQARISELEPRALYVHCNAHSLNLVVQDGMEHVTIVKNFIGLVKDLINFIRDSPKRLGCFKALQSDNSPALVQFCPTRWCVRVKSLKTLNEPSNFEAARLFFQQLETDSTLESSSFAKALGFSKQLESFEFYFLLNCMIRIFEIIEILNTNLQKTDLNIHESQQKIKDVTVLLTQNRESSFESTWKDATTNANKMGLEEPKLPRFRKIPKRLENEHSDSGYRFSTPKSYYKHMYMEIYDQVVVSLNERFSTKTLELLCAIEKVVLNTRADDVLHD